MAVRPVINETTKQNTQQNKVTTMNINYGQNSIPVFLNAHSNKVKISSDKLKLNWIVLHKKADGTCFKFDYVTSQQIRTKQGKVEKST